MSDGQVVREGQEQTGAAGVAAVEPAAAPEYSPVPVSIKTLLEAGAHFGHKAERWNPKMLPYIYGERNKIHIINLDITIEMWERARKFVLDIASRGGKVLMVGTKPQAREVIRSAALRCGSFYVNNRWLGGTMSNLSTIRNSVSRMKKLEELLRQAETPDSGIRLAKKERLEISRQLAKLEINLGGIRDMNKHPDVVFVVDINKESIAVAEALKLHIPVIALVDTNVDPSKIRFPIPCNDDAAGAIRLLVNGAADAVLEGRKMYEARLAEMESQQRREERHRPEPRPAPKAEAAAGEPAVEKRSRPGRGRGSSTSEGEAGAE